MHIVTQPHKVQPSRYALHLMLIWLRRNSWWALGIPVLVSLLLAYAIDIKFLYMSVVLFCLILPHIFVTIYWHYLLSDHICRWLPLHTVTVSDETVAVDYVDDEEENEAGGDAVARPSREPFSIPCGSVSGCRLAHECLLMTVDNNPYHIVLIPYSAFTEPTDPIVLIRHLNKFVSS